MKARLFQEVGALASGWAAAALDLGVAVPAWIARHWAIGRGTQVRITETPDRISMSVTNHFPDTAQAEADQTQRLIAFAKRSAIGKLVRQLPYLLRRSVK